MLTQKDMPALVEMFADKVKEETGEEMQINSLGLIASEMLQKKLEEMIRLRLKGLSALELKLLVDEVDNQLSSKKKKEPKPVKKDIH